MREGRRAHAGVISGVGIRPAFDPDHIHRHHPDVARPPPPSISTPHQRRESVGEGGRWSAMAYGRARDVVTRQTSCMEPE